MRRDRTVNQVIDGLRCGGKKALPYRNTGRIRTKPMRLRPEAMIPRQTI